jgi:DNA repair protein RadB
MVGNERKISAGSYDLNKWLYGGYETDVITTICGPAGSGKTNFCLLASVSQAKKGRKVIFIDTEGGFSVERVRQIVGDNYKEVLKNIILLKVTNFDEQKRVFAKLLKEIKTRGKIGLIVVDGMAMLYRLELGDAIKSGGEEGIKNINRELAKQMRILAEISRNMGISVIATNQVYADFLSREEQEAGKKAGVRMVGGDILKYWSKCIIELQTAGRRKKAILRKHRSLPEKVLNFEVTNKGIKRRASWFG